ncbi:IS200/IS605 family accessory protein TnpB-related protein, partial [Streptomyces sp. NPDC058572]
SMWGAQHWQKPMTAPRRKATRHDAASIAIGRRAQGHPIRRRTTPPRAYQSDVHGHRTVQADSVALGREETRRPVTDRGQEPPARTGRKQGTRATSAPKTVRDARSDGQRAQDSPLLAD